MRLLVALLGTCYAVSQLRIPFKNYQGMFFRGEAIPGGKRLIEDMPLTLQQDVTYEESKNVLERVIRLYNSCIHS